MKKNSKPNSEYFLVSFFNSIQFKMFLRTAFMLTITLVLVEMVSYRLSSQQISSLTENQELALAETYSERLVQAINAVKADMEFLRALPSFLDYEINRSYGLMEEAKENSEAIRLVFEQLLGRALAYETIQFVSRDDKVIVQALRVLKSPNKVGFGYFKTQAVVASLAKTHQKVLQSQVVFSKELNDNFLIFAIPTLASDGKAFGHIELYYKVSNLTERLSKEKLFDSGHLALITDTGSVIYHPNKNAGESFSSPGSWLKLHSQIQRKHKGNIEFHLGKDYILGFAEVPTTNWITMALAPKDEMLSVLHHIKNLVIVLGSLSILFEIIVSFFFLRLIVMEPLVTLLAATKEIIKGNLNVSSKIRRNDEFGVLSETFDTMAVRLRENRDKLEEYGHLLEKKVEEKTKDIKLILKSVKQGVFKVTEKLTIDTEYSPFLEDLLGEAHLEGKDIVPLLFNDSLNETSVITQVSSILIMSINSNIINFETNCHLLPTQVMRLDSKGIKQCIEADWTPMVDQNDETNAILVTLRDVTEINRLKFEENAQRLELEIVGTLLNCDRDILYDFYKEFRRRFDEIWNLLKDFRPNEIASADKIASIYRNLHTLKGDTQTLGLDLAVEALHKAEQTIAVLGNKSPSQAELTEMAQIFTNAESSVNRYFDIAREKLRFNPETDDGEISDSPTTNQIMRKLRDDSIRNLGTKEKAELINQFHVSLAYLPISEMLKAELKSVSDLAKNLSKTTPQVEVFDSTEDYHFLFSVKHKQKIKSIFTQCLRNSLDHGIEADHERSKKGKPLVGKICLRVDCEKSDPAFVQIFLSDDGGGLNLDQLKAKGLKAGICQASASDEELAELIFRPGLSTKERVTNISGRGVGMDAVKDMIEKAGGKIQVKFMGKKLSSSSVPFLLQISIPADWCYLNPVKH